MNQSKISVRYAKALFMSSKEQNKLNEVYLDMKLISSTLFKTSDYQDLVTNPIIKGEEKIALLKSVYENVIDSLSLNFLIFLVKKGRESYLKNISLYFMKLCRQDFNIKEVDVITSYALSDTIKNNIKSLLSTYFNSQIELYNSVNSEIIGGAIMRIDNMQVDLSIKTQLLEIKKALAESN